METLKSWAARAAPVVLTLAAAIGLALVLLRIRPEKEIAGDFIEFWAAGKIVARGGSPYDPGLQARYQREQGWDKAGIGEGLFDFLPFYYPPWMALASVPFTRGSYATGKMAWLVANCACVVGAGLILRRTVPRVPPLVPLLVLPIFAFSLNVLLLGQTAPLVLLLIVSAWRLLDAGRDRWAGAALAGLTIKPQLTAVLVVAVLVWAGRRGRRGVLGAFAAALGALVLVSSAISPSWPVDFGRARARTPMPIDYHPCLGATWYLLLKTAGLRGWALQVPYLAVALPTVGGVLRAAWDRGRAVADVMAMGTLAAFFVSPYAQPYDFVILLVPILVLMGDHLAEAPGTLLLAAMLVLPYVHLFNLGRLRLGWVDPRLEHRVTFLWVPILIGAVWLVAGRREARSRGLEGEGGVGRYE